MFRVRASNQRVSTIRACRHVRSEFDTRTERPRVGEPQPKGLVEPRPKRSAHPEHDRMDDEPVLVHESAAYELAGKARSADVQVAWELATDCVHRSGVLEDFAQLRREGVWLAGLAVLAAEEAAVAAREHDGLDTESLCHGQGAALRHLAI